MKRFQIFPAVRERIGICVLCLTLRNSQRRFRLLQLASSIVTDSDVSGCWVGIQEQGAKVRKEDEMGIDGFPPDLTPSSPACGGARIFHCFPGVYQKGSRLKIPS